jgi:hypothetical protein
MFTLAGGDWGLGALFQTKEFQVGRSTILIEWIIESKNVPPHGEWCPFMIWASSEEVR